MKLLTIHPGPLMYTRIFLRLEPLGLELVAEAARKAGHEVQLFDLQAESEKALWKRVEAFRPDAVALSCNYLANVPGVVDLAKEIRRRLPDCFVFVGGHSVSFVAEDVLKHGEGAIDCVLKGEGEATIVELLEAARHDRGSLHLVPGVVSPEGEGPPAGFVASLDDLMPARDLLRHRRRYFIGVLDPAASIEFARGCPWDCSFCSAWTFYGRSYRVVSPERAVEDLARVKEPGVFLVDDVAFVKAEHGMAIGEEIARRGIKKQYYLETRGDVLLRNKDVFRFWKELGLRYMFLGIEAIDEEGLELFRKRTSLDKNQEALEFARSLGITVAVNIIADPDWDRERFRALRDWCMEVPEIVNVSINTPYPGTESWRTEARELTTLDYRMFDIQHAVMPTKLPLEDFYTELVETQRFMHRKHLGWSALRGAAKKAAGHLLRGQTNFVKMLYKFDSVFHPKLQLADHERPAKYLMTPPPPPPTTATTGSDLLYVHAPVGRRSRAIDGETERFVDATRI